MKDMRATTLGPPADRVGLLFGEKLAQSMSPFLHSIIYRELGLNWIQMRYESADIAEFLSRMRKQQVYGSLSVLPWLWHY